MTASDAIRAREAAKRPKPAKKPKPVETQGQYERELDKPNHVPGEYVE